MFQVGDEAAIGGLVDAHEIGVALDQMAATEMRSPERVAFRASWSGTTGLPLSGRLRHHDMPSRTLFESWDQFGQITGRSAKIGD